MSAALSLCSRQGSLLFQRKEGGYGQFVTKKKKEKKKDLDTRKKPTRKNLKKFLATNLPLRS